METELLLWTLFGVQKFFQCLALNFPYQHLTVKLLALSLVVRENCLVPCLQLPFVNLKTVKSAFVFLSFRLNDPFNLSRTILFLNSIILPALLTFSRWPRLFLRCSACNWKRTGGSLLYRQYACLWQRYWHMLRWDPLESSDLLQQRWICHSLSSICVV